ncbi:uncharacterized protein [Venturia canescens]|uniref:uncharacterized protein n=1 Tax=Venturia canescens TaxID=32260 RepID=UPI001C9C0065|nr:uncharacterized protein LOC122416076 [Venturia canescens]XP_043284691.1 uncharacterized protein LOC122416076 [Venturia canescens]
METPVRFFLVVTVFLVTAHCRRLHHHRDSGYLNHVQLVHQFRCSSPQPRAIKVEDLLTAGPSPDEIFYPASTVLSRCEGSGCCPDLKHTCGPIETKKVSLVFMVKHRIDSQRDRHHEVIHAVEHTKCGCGFEDDERFIRGNKIE